MFVIKSNRGVRQVINFKALNTECERQPNHTSDVLKLVSQIPSIVDTKTGELLFTVLDAWNGYHSIALEDEAKKYFGFQTEWGVYTYNVAPQGFQGSRDYYTKNMDEVMEKMNKNLPPDEPEETVIITGKGIGVSQTTSTTENNDK